MAAYTNAGHSDTINMSQYKAVYGRDYLLLATYRIEGTAVPPSEDYLNRHQELRNNGDQVLELARIRSTRVAANWRTIHKPISIGEFLMVYGNRFAKESGRIRNLRRDGKDLSRSLITMNKCRTILSRWTQKSSAGRRQFFTV